MLHIYNGSIKFLCLHKNKEFKNDIDFNAKFVTYKNKKLLKYSQWGMKIDFLERKETKNISTTNFKGQIKMIKDRY